MNNLYIYYWFFFVNLYITTPFTSKETHYNFSTISFRLVQQMVNISLLFKKFEFVVYFPR